MILPTINLVARPNMVLPSDTWSFTRTGEAMSINPTGRLAKYTTHQIRQDYGVGDAYGTYQGIVIETGTTNLVHSTRRTVYAWTQTVSGSTVSGSAVASSAGEGIVDPDEMTSSSGNICTIVTIPSSGSLTLTTGASQFANATAFGAGKYTISAYVQVINSGSVTVNLGIGSATGTDKVVEYTSTRQWYRVYSGISLSAAPTSAKIIISGSPGTKVRVDMVQVEFGNLTAIASGTTGVRNNETLTTLNTLGQRVNEREGTLFLMYKHGDNDLNISNSIYPLMSIGDGGGAYGLWVYVVTSNASTNPANAIMVRSKPYAASTYDLIAKTQTQTASTGWMKVAVTYHANVAPFLAVNGTVTSTSTGISVVGPVIATTTTTAPIIRVGHDTISSGLNLLATSDGKNYNIAMTATKTLCLDGNIMHFAYFPRALANADLIAITS
jgi:hypothetical protein